jgi:thiol:disulfide interchange protein DsbD
MKKIFTLSLLIFFANILTAQIIKSPVNWTITTKKLADKTYEIRVTANMQKGWHIYSQNTPEGGPIPTTFSYSKNPLITLQGANKEIGKLEQRFEPLFNVDVKQFSNKVDFVQVIKLKANVKTSVEIAVEFMTCDEKTCLPPTTKKFTVAI